MEMVSTPVALLSRYRISRHSFPVLSNILRITDTDCNTSGLPGTLFCGSGCTVGETVFTSTTITESDNFLLTTITESGLLSVPAPSTTLFTAGGTILSLFCGGVLSAITGFAATDCMESVTFFSGLGSSFAIKTDGTGTGVLFLATAAESVLSGGVGGAFVSLTITEELVADFRAIAFLETVLTRIALSFTTAAIMRANPSVRKLVPGGMSNVLAFSTTGCISSMVCQSYSAQLRVPVFL